MSIFSKNIIKNIIDSVELQPIEDETEQEFDYPSYKDEGRILFEVYHVYRCEDNPIRNKFYEIEVFDYDLDSSVFWLQEGMGVDYFLEELYLEIEETGFYVLEDITGSYIRGDGWTIDDDEEWECGILRRATDEEIETKMLSKRKK